MLTKWASAFKNPPKRVFVVHGEDKVCDEFAEHLHTELGYQAVAPYSGDTYDLLENVCVHEGNRELVEKKKDKPAKASSNVCLVSFRRMKVSQIKNLRNLLTRLILWQISGTDRKLKRNLEIKK